MAKTTGFNTSISDVVTLNTQIIDYVTGLPIITTYITIPITGDEGSIVYEDSAGNPRYHPYAFYGYNPIAATKILSSAVIDEVTYHTTATPLGWSGAIANA